MTPHRDSAALHAHGEEQRTWWGRVWRYWLGPPYFWIDILDGERRPSHSKIMWTIAFIVLNGILVHLTVHFTRWATAANRELTATELGFLLAFGALSCSTAAGLDGFKTWAKTRGGGTVEAFQVIAERELERLPDPASRVEPPDAG